MASAGTSGTVMGEDQRSYIKIETLHGKTPTEIVAIDETWVRDFETGVEITVERVEKSILPTTQKVSTIAIKGQAKDNLCL